MKINTIELLSNSHNRNLKEIIIIFDDNGDFYIFNHSNIIECVKKMRC